MEAAKPKVVMIGAGGHAKVIYDLLSLKYDVVGCTTPSPHPASRLFVLGDDSVLPQLLARGVATAFVAIGDNERRRSRALLARKAGFQMANAISPFTSIAESAAMGSGVAVMPGCVIHADAQIQDDVIINTGSTVDHDCVLADACSIAPGCNLAGHVTVGRGTFLGVGTKVIDGITIGEGCLVGAGAVVVDDLPSFSLAMGVPARVVRNLQRE